MVYKNSGREIEYRWNKSNLWTENRWIAMEKQRFKQTRKAWKILHSRWTATEHLPQTSIRKRIYLTNRTNRTKKTLKTTRDAEQNDRGNSYDAGR